MKPLVSPTEVVNRFIQAVYDWEVDAYGAMERMLMLGELPDCPGDLFSGVPMELTKADGDSIKRMVEEYVLLASKFCVSGRVKHGRGPGSPPQHDPQDEPITGCEEISDSTVHIRTTLRPASAYPTNRVYVVVRRDAEWRLDQIFEYVGDEELPMLA